MTWTQAEGIDICRRLEAIAPLCGAHIALTGGLLYKDGPRKDLDIIVYRIRQWKQVNRERFFEGLHAIGIIKLNDFGFVVKADMEGRGIDFMFPDYGQGSYPTDE